MSRGEVAGPGRARGRQSPFGPRPSKAGRTGHPEPSRGARAKLRPSPWGCPWLWKWPAISCRCSGCARAAVSPASRALETVAPPPRLVLTAPVRGFAPRPRAGLECGGGAFRPCAPAAETSSGSRIARQAPATPLPESPSASPTRARPFPAALKAVLDSSKPLLAAPKGALEPPNPFLVTSLASRSVAQPKGGASPGARHVARH